MGARAVSVLPIRVGIIKVMPKPSAHPQGTETACVLGGR